MKCFTEIQEEDDGMLKTIKFPKNIQTLNDQLPKPKY